MARLQPARRRQDVLFDGPIDLDCAPAARGEASTPAGEVVRSPAQVRVGDAIRVLLHRGSLDARVTDTKEQDDRPQV